MAHDTPLSGANADYLDALYEQFSQNSSNVGADWRDYFTALDKQAVATPTTAPTRPATAPSGLAEHLSSHEEEQVKVIELISAMRYRGHRHADLDPLHLVERPPPHQIWT